MFFHAKWPSKNTHWPKEELHVETNGQHNHQNIYLIMEIRTHSKINTLKNLFLLAVWQLFLSSEPMWGKMRAQTGGLAAPTTCVGQRVSSLACRSRTGRRRCRLKKYFQGQKWREAQTNVYYSYEGCSKHLKRVQNEFKEIMGHWSTSSVVVSTKGESQRVILKEKCISLQKIHKNAESWQEIWDKTEKMWKCKIIYEIW